MLAEDNQSFAVFLLTDAARLLRGEIDRCVMECGLGLTPGLIRTLIVISRHDGVRQRVLAEKMDVEPMTVSSYIDRLEAMGLVERRTDPGDRRAKLVHVTERLSEVAAAVGPLIGTAYERAMDGIDPYARKAVEQALERVRQNLSRAA
ncbi:MarR family winged helix-turn-helix transcriptional regulator [Mangrovibrevibacter kandeliae]|uniref:MarR family winged helix-turn-helix transcriptional regulator n=1 Tax=Mangrovibrevibacter kandeliae TaxID=2968473 RepID=UPI002117E328|nr:MarR family transcriptional regulator [Aurantimonas sp. CSK15Z-1]MCQ8781810.1 MarR family transcriptional regulator [Aurantimonas sp. CSK15Z-1]